MAFFASPGVSTYPWPSPGSWGAQLLESNPQAAFQRLLEQRGSAWNPNPRSQFERGLFGRSQDAYQAYTAALPAGGLSSTYVGWLQQEMPKIFEQAWGASTPSQRGQNQAYPGVGRTRWIGF